MRQTYTDDSKHTYVKAYKRSMGGRKYPERKTTMPNNRWRHVVNGEAVPVQRGDRVTQKEMYGDKNAWNISAEVGLNKQRPERESAIWYANHNDGNNFAGTQWETGLLKKRKK